MNMNQFKRNQFNRLLKLNRIKQDIKKDLTVNPVEEGIKFTINDILKKGKIEESSFYRGAAVGCAKWVFNGINLLFLEYLEGEEKALIQQLRQPTLFS